MQRIFNMLIQNLTTMGNQITTVTFWEDFINVEFTDGKSTYSVHISKEKEKTENA